MKRRATLIPRVLVVGLLTLVLGAVAAIAAVSISGGGSGRSRGASGAVAGKRLSRAPGGGKQSAGAPLASTPRSFAVGLRMLRLRDASRTITLPDGTSEPRRLLTYVRYPALGSPAGVDLAGAAPDRLHGPFPLVVFGHGFDVTPTLYRRLLQSWAHAGYVVVAPVFPRENPTAAGGPDEADLPNQPADMSFLITRMLAASAARSGPLAGLIDAHHIAVSGQSDGGDTALATAFDPRFRDPRVGAAVILSGAEIPSAGSFTFPSGSPALLATQGTADTVNLPSETEAFFDAARRPKYLLRLIGAGHLPPYSGKQPQLGIVERVTRAFLDGYLKHNDAARARLMGLGTVAGVASMRAEP
jgi:dienelactone hydrolase